MIIIIKTILLFTISVAYSQLEIEPVLLTTLIKYLPNSAQTNNFIPTIGRACILHNLYRIQNTIVTNALHNNNHSHLFIINYDAIKQNGRKFQKIIIQLLQFLDTSTKQVHGNYLVELFYLIKDVLSCGSKNNVGKLKIKLDYLIGLNLWNPKIDDWNADENKDNLDVICNHIISIFTDENNYSDNVINLLNNHNLTNTKLPSDIDYLINMNCLNTNIVGQKDINDLNYLLDKGTHITIKLLFGHFENLICIYSDFIQTIVEVNSISDTGVENQKNYLKIIFKEYIEIYELAHKISNIIQTYGRTAVTYMNKMLHYHIKFCEYFKKFIIEYSKAPDTEYYAWNYISNNMSIKEYYYLKYLLIDTQYHISDINKLSRDDPLFNSLCRHCKPYNWISINFETLHYKYLSSYNEFTFGDKINRLIHRRLASEYIVSNIIEFINAYPKIIYGDQ